MPLMNETAVAMTAAGIAEILGTALRDCADASFSVQGFSTDTRTVQPGNCFLALKGESFNGNAYAKAAAEKGAVLCILSEEPAEAPGVPYLVTEDGVAAYGKLANAYLRAQKAKGLRVVAVTGSSGKTTVKDMTAHVLSAKYRTYATTGNHNNHIGVPYTLLHMPAETEIAVIEMGMNHFGEIDRLTRIAEPDAAIITNIGTAHIGNLGSQENIFRAKLEVLNGMDPAKAKLIVPADDAFLAQTDRIALNPAQICYSSRTGSSKAALTADGITETAESTRFTVSFCGETAAVTLPMTGVHNVTDALLAIHAGLLCGMTLSDCAKALADFTPGAMRSERVQIGKVMIIRDYYNANPEAMEAALRSLGTVAGSAKKIAVLGNMNELGDYAADRHRTLGDQCRTYADTAYFCGINYRDFAEGYGTAETAFETQEALITALLRDLRAQAGVPLCILIKGSRGLHMERVNDALTDLLAHK